MEYDILVWHGRTDTRVVLLAQGRCYFEFEKTVYSCDSCWDLDSIAPTASDAVGDVMFWMAIR